MKRLFAIVILLLASTAFAQSYPSPTLNNLQVNGTANITGVATLPHVAISGGTISGLSAPLGFASGGTNAMTAAMAFDNLAPLTTMGDLIYESSAGIANRLGIGTTGQVLSVVDGLPAWMSIAGTGTVTSLNISGGTTGLDFAGGPITSSGTITLSGMLGVPNGGTGTGTSTGSGSVVLSNAPMLDNPTISDGTSPTLTFQSAGSSLIFGLNTGGGSFSIYNSMVGADALSVNLANNNAAFSGAVSIDGLITASDGIATTALTTSSGITTASLTASTPIGVMSGGTGTNTSTGSGSVVLNTAPSISSLTITGGGSSGTNVASFFMQPASGTEIQFYDNTTNGNYGFYNDTTGNTPLYFSQTSDAATFLTPATFDSTLTVAGASNFTGVATLHSPVISTPAITGGTIAGGTITSSPISGSTGAFTTLTASGVFTSTNTTISSSSTTGAITTAGGLGVGGNTYVGGGAVVAGPLTVGGAATFSGTTTVNNATAPTQAAAAGQVLGIGQTYVSETASRALGTIYTNTESQPIYIYVTTNAGGINDAMGFSIDGTLIGMSNQSYGASITTIAFIVPPGDTYEVSAVYGSFTVSAWYELR